MKFCNKCQQTKELSEFAKRSDRPSGVQSTCRACKKAEKLGPYPPDESLTERACSKCKAMKPIAEFSLNKCMVGGYNWWCKACHSTGNRAHYAENIEEEHAKSKVKAKKRKAHKRIYHRQWYLENKTEKLEQNAQWRKDNPVRNRMAIRNWGIRQRLGIPSPGVPNPLDTLSEGQWQEIIAAQGGRCIYCKKKSTKLTIEHITPLSGGGSTALWNIVAACHSCNSRKSTGPVLAPIQPLLLTVAPPYNKKN